MKFDRREFITGAASVAASFVLPWKASAHFHGGDSRGWRTLAFGAGGLCTGFDIAPDGTAIARTDSSLLYLFSGKLTTDWNNPACSWVNIVNVQSMPGAPFTIQNGVGEAVIAYTKTTNFYMMAYNNLGNTITGPDGAYLYYTKNSGGNWTRSNLSWTGDDFGTTNRKSSTRKMLVDPNNENIIWAGMPPNTAAITGLISDGTGALGGTVVTIFTIAGGAIPGFTPTTATITGMISNGTLIPNPATGGTIAGNTLSIFSITSGSLVAGQYVYSGVVGGVNYGELTTGVTTNTSTSWSINGTTLTISDGSPQIFSVGQGLQSSGAAITANTLITAVLGGNQYTVNNSQVVAGSGTLTGRKATMVVSNAIGPATFNLSDAIPGNVMSGQIVWSGIGGTNYGNTTAAITTSIPTSNLYPPAWDIGVTGSTTTLTMHKGTGTGYTTDNAGYAVGAPTINLITGTGTILVGDTFTIAGDGTSYVAASALAAPGALTIYPTLRTAILAGNTPAITISNPQTFGTGPTNIGYGLDSALLTANTMVTAALGNNQYTVNNAQTVSGSGVLNGRKITLSASASVLAPATLNLSNLASNGDLTSVFLSTDGVTFNPIPISTLPQTTMNPAVTGMIFDVQQGTVTGVGGLKATKRMLMAIGGADIYETLDGGVTWNSTGARAAFGTPNFSVWQACMNFKGYYFANVSLYLNQPAVANTTPTVQLWRYSDQVTPGSWIWEQLPVPAGTLGRTAFLYCDPRNGQDYVAYEGGGGGGFCDVSVNASGPVSAPVVFAVHSGGTPGEFAATYDVPWLNHGIANLPSAFIGGTYSMIDNNGYNWWCGNNGFLWLYTQSDHVTPTIPRFDISTNTFSSSIARGVENTVAEFVTRGPLSKYPIFGAQDAGMHSTSDPNVYASDYYMDGPQIAAYGFQAQRVDAWYASYAPSNPLFVCAKLVVVAWGGQASTLPRERLSGYSLDGGQTWTPYVVSPEVADFNLTGNVLCNGGYCCAIDDQHQMFCPAQSRATRPVITVDRGATTGGWFVTDLPSADWAMRQYTFGSSPPGQPFAAAQGANSQSADAWAVQGTTTNTITASGNLVVWKSTNKGVNWSILSTTNIITVSYQAVQLYSVPGHPEDLWMTARFNSSTNSGLWRSTDAGATPFTKLATLPTAGGFFPQYFCLGAPFPGDTYPALYILMWSTNAGQWTTKLYYSRDQGAHWTLVGSTQNMLDLPPSASMTGIKAIFGDWQVPGLVYATVNGSGFVYCRIV